MISYGFPLSSAVPSGRCVLGAVLLFVLGSACQPPSSSVQSHLTGQIIVDSSAGALDAYRDIRLLVVRPDGRRLDTLGHARPGPDGHVQMPISAPERSVYALSLWGRGGREQLASTEYVVAPGDTATLRVRLPLQGEGLRPASPENRALQAYRNAMTMHQRLLTRRLRNAPPSANVQVQNIRLTSSVLWDLRDRYPGTFAAEFAAVESLSLLEGWNDSLVAARAQQIGTASPRYVDAAHIARRAEARLYGHQAALTLLDTLEVRAANARQQAGVQAARIQAFLDSAQVEAALSASQRLRARFPRTSWAEWARRTEYEAARLRPGMTAPNLTLRTLRGDTLSLRSLRGRPVVLEYYRPGLDLYALQRPLRNALYNATRADSVAFISISTEPDTLVNRAFLRNRPLPGRRAIAADGTSDPLVTRYNAVRVPRWVLIDDTGAIVDCYRAGDFPALRQSLAQLLRPEPSADAPLSLP
ncbi:TlpA family protein disulfide reductase [Salinibacter grassmerensis]|uniref:TlpA family protein disulfide reductase n=1 Tax=Salinibacter grassmerensis TaxID=3040353 RepID=UPI0021E7BB75|nr:hypothetical protein [Salinibacter grassmerensis]